MRDKIITDYLQSASHRVGHNFSILGRLSEADLNKAVRMLNRLTSETLKNTTLVPETGHSKRFGVKFCVLCV